MTRLDVGQAYPLPIGSEGGRYSYHGQHDLLLAFGRLMRREVEDVRQGPAEFGLFGSHGILFFLYRFGSVGGVIARTHGTWNQPWKFQRCRKATSGSCSP